jgi:hypothetical protein
LNFEYLFEYLFFNRLVKKPLTNITYFSQFFSVK